MNGFYYRAKESPETKRRRLEVNRIAIENKRLDALGVICIIDIYPRWMLKRRSLETVEQRAVRLEKACLDARRRRCDAFIKLL
jgi:hypothetical protein